MSRGAHPNRLSVIGGILAAALALVPFAPAGQGQTSQPATSNKNHSSATSASTPKKAVAPSATVPKAGPSTSKATGGLVHKSAAYWSGYKSDIIQRVFDGAFRGAEMDSDVPFHILFGGYVEQYSNSCSDYLKGHFDRRTITQSSNGMVSTSVMNIDYRYLAKYDEYSQGGGLDTLRVLTGAASLSSVMTPAFDIIRFFAIEKCDSAAMRQLGENLLRGANGKPSLQASGGSIAGAAAESQVDAAPAPAAASRLGAFGDGCNAFMRDPKTSRYAPSDPDAYCKCLSDGYRGVMTPAEQADYGKNFEAKFWRGIAQPRSDDPAWPRLNPVAVSCMQ
jgi:hypothetical protein